MVAIVWAVTALAIAALLAIAMLKAWRGWLDLERHRIAAARDTALEVPDAATGVRIEMANFKERLRKLEAIAQGVDL